MKVVKILGVVFGALFLLTGVALLAGSAVFGAGQGKFDQQLAEQGLAGPVTGTVTAIEPPVYTVDYTDKSGAPQTGRGQVAEGTTPPEQGDDVQVYYSTLDASQIIILDFPGGNFAGVAGLLRTVAYICLAIGVVLLIAGIIGLVTARRTAAAVAAGADSPAVASSGPTSGQGAAAQAGQPPPGTAQTASAGPDIDPTPTRPFPKDPPPPDPAPQDPAPPVAPEPEQNRPGG